MSLIAGDEGITVYDETTKTYWLWNGTAWANFAYSSTAWKLTGNTGTSNGTSFIETTDEQDLDIRTNNIIKLWISTQGQLEFLNTGNSIFFGLNAGENDDLSSNQNIFIGHYATNSNTTGSHNIALGYHASDNITTGALLW